MGTFSAGLVWLPSLPAAFGLASLLGLAGVRLLKGAVWRNAALMTAATACGLAVVETAAAFFMPRAVNFEVVKTHAPVNWTPYEPVLGYRPLPGTRVSALATWRGETVYRQTYTIDGSGARLTPGTGGTGDTYLFIGDSFVFGEGLSDSETLPAAFARELGGKGHVVNLGVVGYGPNHLVRALETGAYDSQVSDPVKAVVTWIIPAQLARVTGDGSWLGSSPRYVLGDDGTLAHTGSFLAYRLANPLAGLGYLLGKNLNTAWLAAGAWTDEARADLFVALMARLKQLVQERYKAPLVVIYQWPDWLPASSADEALVATLRAIERLGMPMVSANRIIGDGDRSAYFFAHDGHPTALLNRLVAKALKPQVEF